METFMATPTINQARFFLVVTGITISTLVTKPLVATIHEVNQINRNFVVR